MEKGSRQQTAKKKTCTVRIHRKPIVVTGVSPGHSINFIGHVKKDLNGLTEAMLEVLYKELSESHKIKRNQICICETRKKPEKKKGEIVFCRRPITIVGVLQESSYDVIEKLCKVYYPLDTLTKVNVGEIAERIGVKSFHIQIEQPVFSIRPNTGRRKRVPKEDLIVLRKRIETILDNSSMEEQP